MWLAYCYTETRGTAGSKAQEPWFCAQGQTTFQQALRRKFKAAPISNPPGLAAIAGSEAKPLPTVPQVLLVSFFSALNIHSPLPTPIKHSIARPDNDFITISLSQ